MVVLIVLFFQTAKNEIPISAVQDDATASKMFENEPVDPSQLPK